MENFYITRWLWQRALGVVYLIAFAAIIHQFKPLLGERGLLPVPEFVKRVSFWDFPSLFHTVPRDWAFTLFGWIGVALALIVVLGISEKYGLGFSMMIWGLLWALYLSFVNVGQVWYSFGWETLLLEAGFLTMFLGDAKTAPPTVVIWLLRWLLFRLMFGAGLIKIRGDSCWRDLTCMYYYYETQPMPNPLSWYFHWMPMWFHKMGVLYNHFVELIVPWGYFVPGAISAISGVFSLGLMGMIFISGNLAFLNFLTIVLIIPVFNDQFWSRVLPVSIQQAAAGGPIYQGAVITLAIVVGILSIKPILNMLSPRQIMNTSFDSLHLVNTYGAFGSITRPRYEVIVEGSADGQNWREYEFVGKPGSLARMPPQIAPYHLRLDWLMWFAGFTPHEYYPWFSRFMEKLLEGDRPVLSLLRYNPFSDGLPKYVRARLYEYHFTTPDEKKQTGNWWKRELRGEYFPMLSLADRK